MTTGWIVVDVVMTLALAATLWRSEARRARPQWVVDGMRKELETSWSAMRRPAADPRRSVAVESGVIGAIAVLDVHDGDEARAARLRQFDESPPRPVRAVETTMRDMEDMR